MSAATTAAPTGLAQVLARRGLTVAQAAARCQVPVQDLTKLHDGQAAGIRFTTLTAVCTGLDCTPGQLLEAPDYPAVLSRRQGWWGRAWAYRSTPITVITAAVSCLACLAFLLVVVAAVNPVDFLAYRYAAADAWAGQNIYLVNADGPLMPEGGLPFTYTPFAALVLLVTTLGEARTAFLAWTAAAALLTITTLWAVLPARWRDRPVLVGLITVWGTCNVVIAHHLIFGQINVFLMALILIDLTRPADAPPRWLPAGVLTGIAAAIKLTPALFIVYLWISGQRQAARTGALTTAAATTLGWIVYPEASRQFFTTTLWHLSDRVSLDGFFATSGNQSVHGALAAIGPWTTPLALVLSGLLALAGLTAAASTHRAGRRLEAVLIVGLTACLISPVSWMHHWVYLLPALLLLAQYDRPWTRCWAWTGAAVLLATGPTLGDLLLSWDIPALLLLAVALRESLLLLGLASMALLSTPPSDDEGRRAPPATPDTATHLPKKAAN